MELDQVKLLPGMLHGVGAVIGQTHVGDDESTCELNSMRPLLKRLGDLQSRVITADALHCQRDHAEAIVAEHHGHYLFGVKDNQPGLLAALEAIDESKFSAEHTTENRGHGRIETRYAAVAAVAPVPEGLFPHATQVVRITRDRADLSNEGTITVTWYITSLPAGKAGPKELGDLARSHWGIENRLRWVRSRCRLPRGRIHRQDRQRSTSDGDTPEHRDRAPTHQRRNLHRCCTTQLRLEPHSSPRRPGM